MIAQQRPRVVVDQQAPRVHDQEVVAGERDLPRDDEVRVGNDAGVAGGEVDDA